MLYIRSLLPEPKLVIADIKLVFQVNALAGLLVGHYKSVRHVSNVELKNNWGLFSSIF